MEKTQLTSRKQIMPSSIDRLSTFSDDILCHILSFLPTKTSVSTSILAHRWKFLWAHVPNLSFCHGRGKTPKIDTIYNKVMLLYRVKNMNSLRLFADDDDDTESCRSQLTACIQDAINRNVKKIDLFFSIAYTFPICIFNCKTLVNLRLAGYGDITLMTGDDVWLPALEKFFLDSVGYECEETLPYLLSHCPVLEELTVHRSDPDDVDCFIVSSRTINRLILDSNFFAYFNMNNRHKVKIDAPELRYLKVHDFASNDVKSGSLTSLIEADVNLNGDEDDDSTFHVDASVEDDIIDVSDDDDASVESDPDNVSNGDDDDEFVEDDANDVSDDDDDEGVQGDVNDAPVEGDGNDFPEDDANDVSDDDAGVQGDANDAPVEGDDNDLPNENALNNEASVERMALRYARSVFEFVGGLYNVKYLRLKTCRMDVSDSVFSTWPVMFNNLIKLELRCDWRFIPIFLQTADNLQVLRICTYHDFYKYWIEPNEVPPCLSTHLETVRFDHFEIVEPEMSIIKYILKNAKVLKRMEIHSKDNGIDLEKRSEAFNLISLFERGSVECLLDFH